ncbi:DUF3307 domain-containing protein [Sedimentibacter sp.]|uniref:DUF3307 domain-containing protein n=1 Tax=Sedimentibacter sp. TaxID=1960295 RepID=UPI0028B02B43|nr:DUF3307 domain-containing protein [Sedimentibacter sp.]
MFRRYLILLLLAHIVADFYIQTEKMSDKKDESIRWVIIHSSYYFGIMLLIAVPVISYEIVSGAVIASAFHLLIDMIKFMCISAINKKGKMSKIIERNLFFTDQILHFVSLIGVAYWQTKNNIRINEWKMISEFFNIAGLSAFSFVSWSFMLLLIHKPSNIAIQKLLAIYKPISDKEEFNNAGRFIGTVERIIMLIFLSIEQYSAIGLVLTAKSVARYDKISKEKDFAEYYLLGTLLSTVVVIVVSFVL